MPRDSLIHVRWCLLAIAAGCASAGDASEEDAESGAPSSTAAPNRPNNGRNAGTSGSATGSGGAGNGASGVDPSGAVAGPSSASGGRTSASGGRPSASMGGRPSAPSDDDDDDDDDEPGGSGGAPASGGSSSTPPTSDDDVPSFATDILPILRTSCGSCHGAGFLPRFAASNADAAYTVAVDLSNDIVERIDAGTMPPACGGNPPGSRGCVSVDDFEEIEAWVDGDTPE